MNEETRLGLSIYLTSLAALADAQIGQCEAHDLVSTASSSVDQRCESTGVRIRETTVNGHIRHRTVCPAHGYEPPFTPPVPAWER